MVIGTDTDRFATYYFLLTFHSNHGIISYHFRDIRRFQLKIAKFSHLLFCVPAEGVPLELGTGAGGQKTRMMGLPGQQRSLTIYSAVNAQTWQTDGRKDAHTGPQQRPRLRIASRGKKNKNSIIIMTYYATRQQIKYNGIQLKHMYKIYVTLQEHVKDLSTNVIKNFTHYTHLKKYRYSNKKHTSD